MMTRMAIGYQSVSDRVYAFTRLWVYFCVVVMPNQ